MTPADAYLALRSAGLTVRADGGQLLLSPKELLTDDLLALAKVHKPALLAILADTRHVEALEMQREMQDFFSRALSEGNPLLMAEHIPTKYGPAPSLATKRLMGLVPG